MAPEPARPPGPLLAIEDPGDERLGDYRRLKDPAARAVIEQGGGIFTIEGRLAVANALAAGIEFCSLLVEDRRAGALSGLIDALSATGAPIYLASQPVIAATVGFPLHRGVVATARRPTPRRFAELVAEAAAGPAPARLVLAEGLNDHENLGALFRNAAAFGASAVLLDPTCADPLYRRSVRVSLGHVCSVPFARLEPWPDGLSLLRRHDIAVVALAPPAPAHRQPGAASPGLAELAVRRCRHAGIALAVGAEGPGLSPAVLERADLVVAIPMAPGVDSLNVATAAAIALYELAVR
ncbi:MAG: RNA methyltransferase [Actinomycetota bacterium]|nr:RNA methyltransferase [Actinomycetota bacterium]